MMINKGLFSSNTGEWSTPQWIFDELNTNPPYGRNINKWIQKAYVESRKSNCIVVGLLPARTDTKWFHDYIYPNKAEIRFIKGRLKFGDGLNSAPFPSMIVIWKASI